MFSINKILFFMALSFAMSFSCQAEQSKAEAVKASAQGAFGGCPNWKDKSHANQKFEHSRLITVPNPLDPNANVSVCLHWCQPAAQSPNEPTC